LRRTDGEKDDDDDDDDNMTIRKKDFHTHLRVCVPFAFCYSTTTTVVELKTNSTFCTFVSRMYLSVCTRLVLGFTPVCSTIL